MERLFAWVSASVAVTSRAVGTGADGAAHWTASLEKAPLKDGIRLVKSDDAPPRAARPRIFIHGTCRKTGGKYLVVYRADPSSSLYVSQGTFPLPYDFYADGKAAAPADGSLLRGPATCPYCGNDGMVFCHVCKCSYCWNSEDPADSYHCAGCGRTFELSSDGSFDVNGSQG
jgi:hypothetical protein